ncbi:MULTISPECIES: NAD(P)/FAD-dependent oxidoreductase [Sporosarcina]|uniref:NAD(P)/FAD-dependent oxidoreductase n=1 Tax=Sporosarcina TaxID=1569 RepID=UPI00058ADD97|nr:MULTISPECIES: FAD-dependent oxidoreductase [Sporosarcina]WJY28643.1 FAD-dependent oxidoreductase [Sporosarcina sp. 0.2-SM1T-5]
MLRTIVIGGGIAGCAAAYELAKRGCRVTVIDRDDKGRATDAAAGIICPWLSQRRNQDWYRLVREGARHYRVLIPELEQLGETETGYRQVGALSLFTDQKKLEKAYERALSRREDAPEIGEVHMLDETEVKDAYPPAAEGYRALYVSGAARVDGRQLRLALKRAAERLGARFIAGNAVLDSYAVGCLSLRAGSESFTADRLIFATGAWPPALEAAGIQLDIRGQKAQIVHLDPHDSGASDWPVVIPPGDQYLLSFDDGRVAAGATHEDEDVFNTAATAGGLHEVLDKALRVAPGLAASEWIGARAGVRPFTPGFLPVAGEIPTHPGLYVVNGLGASGLTAGPFIGKLIAQMCTGEKTDLEMDVYSPDQAIRAL